MALTTYQKECSDDILDFFGKVFWGIGFSLDTYWKDEYGCRIALSAPEEWVFDRAYAGDTLPSETYNVNDVCQEFVSELVSYYDFDKELSGYDLRVDAQNSVKDCEIEFVKNERWISMSINIVAIEGI